MSKIVTIPTDGMNPFVVTHNGEKYVFTPGETVEVSDGVALEIEEYKRWREKYYGTIDPPYEGGGEIEALTVSENGTYTPPEGVDGYAPVTVNVVPPASDIDALIDGSLTEIKSNAASVRQYAFYKFSNLTSVNFPSATSVEMNAFDNCSNLTSVNFPKVKSIAESAFAWCSNLTSVNFPSATNVGKVAFLSCFNLTSVNFPSATNVGLNAFKNCSKLTSAKFPSLTSIDSAFNACYKLTRVDFPKARSIMSSSAFSDCSSLTSVILRSETMCTLASTSAFSNCFHFHGTVNATYNPDGLKDGYIYVPRALIDSYKVATNWVTFADQFRALEDYTVDGTTTGELDESKVSL